MSSPSTGRRRRRPLPAAKSVLAVLAPTPLVIGIALTIASGAALAAAPVSGAGPYPGK